MAAKVEVYAKDGSILLDSTTQILTAIGDFNYIPSVNYNGGTVQGWRFNWDVNRWLDAQTGATSTQGYDNFQMVYNTAPPAGAVQAWYAPNDGTSLMLSPNSFGISNKGSGARVVYTGKGKPNTHGGFAETYNESGELLWSVGSLIKSPVIVDVLMLTATNATPYTYNLAQHGNKKERIFFFCCYNGYFDVVIDESSSSQTNRTILVKRVVDMCYFRPKEFTITNEFPVAILVAYIPAP